MRDVNEVLREKDDYFRRIQKEEECIAPVAKEQRCTLDVLSKYEKAKVLGIRADQLSKNSPTYAKVLPDRLCTLSAFQIA